MTSIRICDEIIATAKHASIDALLDAFNFSASVGDLVGYFSCFASVNSRFLGTDKAENWSATEFFQYAGHHFNGTSAWIYRPIPGKRVYDIFPSTDRPVFATFDEWLESESFGATSRGTGTLHFIGGYWYIAAYHLSFPIPNEIAKVMTATIDKYEKGNAVKEADAMAAQLIKELDMESTKKGKGKKMEK